MNYIVKKSVSINGQDMLLTPMDIDYSNRVINIVGIIDDDMAAVVNSALRSMARESDDDIWVYVMSYGGSVSAGLSIKDTADAIRCDVNTIACGMAASMGAFIVSAAGTKGKRWAQPNAEFLIHQPIGGISGQASDMKIHVEHILNTRRKLNKILAHCTGQSIKKIESDTERDYIMGVKEALEYGLIDKIGDPISEL